MYYRTITIAFVLVRSSSFLPPPERGIIWSHERRERTGSPVGRPSGDRRVMILLVTRTGPAPLRLCNRNMC